jgi:hypothetical protein
LPNCCAPELAYKALAVNPSETLKAGAIFGNWIQNLAMADPIASGRYRVRAAVEREQSVPLQVQAARFNTRDDAETFAQLVAHDRLQNVVVEKLAPGGCWLQLSLVACAF